MKNQLEQLKSFSKVVVDTGDIEAIRQYTPIDSTTNPSLILKAASKPIYKPLIDEAVQHSKKMSHSEEERRTLLMDCLFVNFGAEILKIIPGRVSTEIDAHYSFDVEKTVSTAHTLMGLYAEKGIPRERILLKIATTWEGIQAAKILEKEGIHCNMTLLFSLTQAIACAEARVTLLSPFVGRITDWHKKAQGVADFPVDADPGVQSLKEIYTYLKHFDYPIQIMGASFRSKAQVLALAGCDLLTISPQLLQELSTSEEVVNKQLDAKKSEYLEKISLDEKQFRWMMNCNQMATEKLSEGIRIFAQDFETLQKKILSL